MSRALIGAALLVAAAASGCPDKRRERVTDAAPSASTTAELPANARVALSSPPGNDRAIAAAEDAVRRDTKSAAAWVALGHAWIEKAQATNDPALYVNADACASVVLGTEPDDAAAAHVRSVALLGRRLFEDARKNAERATAKHPRDATAWGDLTDALRDLGRYDEADDAAVKMLEIAPSTEAYARVSRLQWLRNDVAGAKRSIARAIEAAADDAAAASAHADAGMISWQEGDYSAADASFDRALARASASASALAGKGRVAMARRDYGRAADFFARAYDAQPSSETAWLLGDARDAGGDAKGAADAYALVARGAAADSVTASLFLSSKRQPTKEERDEAIRLAGAEHVKGIGVYTEDAMAWALYRADMIAAARTTVGRARRLHTPDARLLFHEGAIRIAAGDTKAGRALVARALAMNPAFDLRGAREARELVK